MNGDMAGVVAETLTLPPWNFEFREMMLSLLPYFYGCHLSITWLQNQIGRDYWVFLGEITLFEYILDFPMALMVLMKILCSKCSTVECFKL